MFFPTQNYWNIIPLPRIAVGNSFRHDKDFKTFTFTFRNHLISTKRKIILNPIIVSFVTCQKLIKYKEVEINVWTMWNYESEIYSLPCFLPNSDPWKYITVEIQNVVVVIIVSFLDKVQSIYSQILKEIQHCFCFLKKISKSALCEKPNRYHARFTNIWLFKIIFSWGISC